MDAGKGWFVSVLAAAMVALAIPNAVIATHMRLAAAAQSATAIRAQAARAPWAPVCTGAKPAVCVIEQNVYLDAGPGARPVPLMRVSVGHVAADPRLRMVLTLPAGIMLQSGVGFSIDGGAESQLPVENCADGGCRASLVIDQGGREKLEASKLIQVSFVNAAGKDVVLPVKLDGFADALKRIGA